VNTTLRFLVADDHEVLRRGLREILECHPGWTVVGEALTGREAVEKAVNLKPEVLILDISMPELNGVETARRVRAAVPECQILILTQHNSPQLAEAALAAGAQGYLLKSDAARDLVTAVESLRQGRPFLTAKVAQMVLEGYRQTLIQRGSADALTSREREVLQLLAEGKTNPQIAATLDISVKTAETHRARVMRKLQLRSIPDLVTYAVRNGLVQP
jgi:DNA-binding NarL/FixJ family response regulator